MSSEYKRQVSKFSKKDAVVACGIYLLYVVVSTVIILVYQVVEESLTHSQVGLLGGFLGFICPIIVFVLVKKNKQGLSSLGIRKEKMLVALRLGVVFSFIPITFGEILPRVLYGGEVQAFGAIIFTLFLTFLFASAEDIMFVSYLQTRIHGLIKSEKIAICLVATMFSLGHIPPWLVAGQLDFQNLLPVGISILSWFLAHVAYVLVFKRYFSLFPIMLMHTMNNFSWGSIWVISDTHTTDAEEWRMLGGLVYFLAICIWALFMRFRKKQLHFKT